MRRLWMIVMAAGAAGAAAAQPVIPTTADPSELAAAERLAADKTLSAREREAAADRAIEARRALIVAAPDTDARLTGWLIDQASALLARLGRDGADSEALFGIALRDQQDSVQKAASEAATLLERAARRAAAASKALTDQNVLPEDPRLAPIEQERTVRAPFFRVRAEALLAGVASGAEGARHAEAALSAVAKLALANPGPEAIRRVNVAAAKLLERTPPAAADAQEALDECAGVVKSAEEKPGVVAPVTVAEAWLGMIRAGVALGRVDQSVKALDAALAQPPFTEGGRGDPLLCVLAADAATRALYERGVATGDAALLNRAVAVQEALVARPDLGLRPESLRPLVLEKLAILAADAPEAMTLPPAFRLARGIAAAREPARRAEALKTFDGVAADAGAGGYAADALWEEAVLLTQPPPGTPENRLKAAGALTRLARDYPKHGRAQEAIAAALAYSRALALESPDPAMRRSGREAYAAALEVATTKHPSLANIDLWRYERARLLADPGVGQPAPSLDQLDTALGLLEAIPPGSPVDADARALYERTQSASLDDLFRRLGELRRAGDAAGATALARDTIVPKATRAVGWARSHQGSQLDRFRLDLADATVEAGRSARATYQELLPRAASLPGGEARVRFGLARSTALSGDAAAGFQMLRQVAASLDAPVGGEAGGPVRPELYWHAWTLMLEMLGEQNSDGSRSATIRTHIKRLRSVDPSLGGEPWKGRIEAVEARLGG